MSIIIGKLEKCSICSRNSLKPHIHHINGIHEDNRKENRIKICQDCHTAIHKPIGKSKWRGYGRESDEKIIIKIHELRLILHKSKYKNKKYLPFDFITKKVLEMERIERFIEKSLQGFENVKVIRYS